MSCQDRKIETAQEIIDKDIRKQCSGNCGAVRISFDFRNKHYVSTRQKGKYQFERHFSDSLGFVVDILKNDGFTRTINKADITLSDSLKTLYGNSVNSVHYFTQLPFGLNDAAVQKGCGGRPIYDDNEAAVGVVVAQLNRLKMAKTIR